MAQNNSLQNITGLAWRSPECLARYEEAITSKTLGPILDEPRKKEWKYWVIIQNTYPYDVLFETHDLLFPKRVASRRQLNSVEMQELEDILEEIEHSYDRQIINFPSSQSISDHFHIHLVSDKKK